MAKGPVDLRRKNRVAVATEDGTTGEQPDALLVTTDRHRGAHLLERVSFLDSAERNHQEPLVSRKYYRVWMTALAILLLVDGFDHASFVEHFPGGDRVYLMYCVVLACVTAYIIRGRFKSFVEAAAIATVFLIGILSFSQLTEDVLEVTVRPVPEAFATEARITKESLENDIVGRISEIRGLAETDQKWVGGEFLSADEVVSQANARKVSNSDGNVKSASGTKSRADDVRIAITSEGASKNAIDLQISPVGISLQTMLQSLKRQEWVMDLFDYKYATVTCDVIWSAEDKQWMLLFRYADMNGTSSPVQKIPWSDSALSKFGELTLEQRDPISILSYYNNLGRDGSLNRYCDELIAAGTIPDVAYFYKGEVAYRSGEYKKALVYHESARNVNMKALVDHESARNVNTIDRTIEYDVARARDLKGLNRQQDAETVLNAVLVLEPDNENALYVKADLLDDMGRYTDSSHLLHRLETVKQVQGNKAAYSNLKAYVAYQSGNVDEALAGFSEAILLSPKYSWYYHLKGSILERMSDSPEKLTEALWLYDQALELEPKNATYYDDKRQLLIVMGRESEVAALLEKALGQFPDITSAADLQQRGKLYGLFGEYDQAVAAYEAAIKLNKANPALYDAEGDIFADYLDNPDKARPLYEKAVALDGENLSYRMSLGWSLYDLKRYSEAIDVFEDIIAMDPYYVDAYRGKAVVLEEQDMFEEALPLREKAVALDPGSGFHQYWLASLKEDMKDVDGALVGFKKAADLSRWHSDADQRYYRVAELLYDKGTCSVDGLSDDKELKHECDEALEYYDRSLSVNPKYIDSLIGKASVLNDFDRNDEALPFVNVAIELDPKNAWAYTVKGYVLCGQYENSESDEAFKKAHALDPEQYNLKHCSIKDGYTVRMFR